MYPRGKRNDDDDDDRDRTPTPAINYNPPEVERILLTNGVTLDVVPGTFQEEWVSVPRKGRVELFRFNDLRAPDLQVIGESDQIVAIWTRAQLEPTPTDDAGSTT